MTTENTVPNPGSVEAVKAGCQCAIMDNHYGRGVMVDGAILFWINGSCRLHAEDYDYSAFS